MMTKVPRLFSAGDRTMRTGILIGEKGRRMQILIPRLTEEIVVILILMGDLDITTE